MNVSKLQIPKRLMGLSVLLILAGNSALAGVHLWRVKEVFSNSDGTVQFIEIATCCGSMTENTLVNRPVSSNSNTFIIPGNVGGSTLNKHVLLATAGFVPLAGAPLPDHIIPDNFFSTTADTIVFSIYDTLVFGAGALPLDGTTSLNKVPDDATDTTFTATNSPTNYGDQSGSVNAVTGPPAVPDGGGGTAPLTVAALTADASTLQVAFDSGTCTNAVTHHILYGQGSGLPSTPSGNFTLLGSVCAIGSASPYTWIGVPEPTDGSNLIWVLMVTTDADGIEGSWGLDAGLQERHGPGFAGSSDVCATDKSVTNSCGTGGS